MAQAIPLALMVAGPLLSAGGSIISSNSQANDLRSQADQLDVQAGEDRASSQRQAMEQRRQARLLQSRALAVAASSGGGADDPTVVNLISGIQGEGEYRALTSLYEGETSARTKERQAESDRRSAKDVKTAGTLKAVSSIIGMGSSLYDKFGK